LCTGCTVLVNSRARAVARRWTPSTCFSVMWLGGRRNEKLRSDELIMVTQSCELKHTDVEKTEQSMWYQVAFVDCASTRKGIVVRTLSAWYQ
jgi:hypothetical protein